MTIASKPSYNRSFLFPSKLVSSSSSVNPVNSSSAKPATFEKKIVSEPAKVNPRTQCYRCQGYGHLASQYQSQTKTLLVEVHIEDVEEDGLEEIVQKQDDDSDTPVEECEFNGCIRTLTITNLTPCYDKVQLRYLRALQHSLRKLTSGEETSYSKHVQKLRKRVVK